MEIMRLMVTGPHGAGKSSFIQAVSQFGRHSITPDDGITVAGAVTDNFGQLYVGPDQRLHLYRTPVTAGQPVFNLIWDMLLQTVHAYILLVPIKHPQGFRHAQLIHQFIQTRVALPMIVGVTSPETNSAWDIETVAIALGFTPAYPCPPIVALDPNDCVSVSEAMMTLVHHCFMHERRHRG